MCAQKDLGGTLPWEPCAVPVASPSQGGERENHMSLLSPSFHPTSLHSPLHQMQPLAQPPNPCVTETHTVLTLQASVSTKPSGGQ